MWSLSLLREAIAQQPEAVRRIAVLHPIAENDPDGQQRTIRIPRRAGEARLDRRAQRSNRPSLGGCDPERVRTYAAELVGLKPDVILASTSLVLQPLQRETRTIPIVFINIHDPTRLRRQFDASRRKHHRIYTGRVLDRWEDAAAQAELQWPSPVAETSSGRNGLG